MSIASEHAVKLVAAALQSQSIKLIGSHITSGQAQNHAISDAAYLSKLLTDLTASIEKLG